MEPAGVVLLGRGGAVVAMNPLAAQVWDSADFAPVRGATSSGLLDLYAGQLTRIDCASGRLPYLLSITPLLGGSAEESYHVLTIYDPERAAAVSRASLEALFHFTRAEMRLVEQLLHGRMPAQAAEALGVTIHTVRTYLKRLYHKVGVRSQATLMRRLVQVASGALPAPVPSAPAVPAASSRRPLTTPAPAGDIQESAVA
jgi:DNA-binding CsgD family transcriptional regulator